MAEAEKTVSAAWPSVRERLLKVQIALKAPKGQKNTFGNYAYRSTEDVLEALKPHLDEHNLVLTLEDDLVLIGERYYVKATATVIDVHLTGEHIPVTAFAREEETKKGMDGSQITGAASSYARKYALNGLFLVDDTKDSDATNQHDKAPVASKSPRIEFGDSNRDAEEQVTDAMNAERVHDATLKKLSGALLLKDIVGAQQIADVLNGIARAEYDVKGVRDLDEVQAQAIYKRLILPTTKKEDLLKVVAPFDPIN